MPSTLRKSSITPRQREGRAINAVADLLRRTLRVPNIYLEPPSSVIAADVLAVDSGGAGDLHAVEVKLEPDLNPSSDHSERPGSPAELNQRHALWYSRFSKKIRVIHHQLMTMPAHYRYFAMPAEAYDLVLGEIGQLGLFSPDGIGRLGLIKVNETGTGVPTAEIAITPERFRVDPAKLRTIETKLLAKSRPDIEVRI